MFEVILLHLNLNAIEFDFHIDDNFMQLKLFQQLLIEIVIKLLQMHEVLNRHFN